VTHEYTKGWKGVGGVGGVVKIIFKNEYYLHITSLVRKTEEIFRGVYVMT